MDFEYEKIADYYDHDYWNVPGAKSGYINMTAAIGGKWHQQACGWFNATIPVKNKKLFDAGCGLGHFMVGFKELGAEVYGCDVSDYCALINTARFGLKFYHTSLEIMKGIPENYFDIVFCTSTMEHIPGNLIVRVFSNLITICKPGGIVYIEIDTTPNDQKPVPEASHVNIRPWPLWLLEIYRQEYWWNHAKDLEIGLLEEKRFPGFPHPDWKFAVMEKNTMKITDLDC